MRHTLADFPVGTPAGTFIGNDVDAPLYSGTVTAHRDGQARITRYHENRSQKTPQCGMPMDHKWINPTRMVMM